MRKRNLIAILMVSVAMTTFGFLIDSDPITANIGVNIFEFTMLTTIFFGIFLLSYLASVFTYNQVKKYYERHI